MDRDDVVNLIKTKKRIGDLARSTKQRIQCPFCNSDGLDMQLYHDTNRFRCWVTQCGKHGSPIDWVMFERSQTFNEAVRTLASDLGIDISFTDNRAPVLQKASRSFVKALSRNSEATEYWESRGIDYDTLYKHHVGYCSEDVLKDITRAQDLEDRVAWQTLEDAGLVSHGRPAFWNHTIFPYRHWKTRQIVQMQGRVLGETNALQGRWKGLETRSKLGFRSLNSMLWGEEELLNYWKRPKNGKTYAFVLEGIPDALTLRQRDIHALSIVGNQNLRIHTRSLKNLDQVFLVLDNDNSSQNNLPWELYDMLLEMPKTQIIPVQLPKITGEKKVDVNEYFLKGATIEDFNKVVNQSSDACMFLVNAWGSNESMYEPLLTLICERPVDERPALLQQLSGFGLFTTDQLLAFARMLRLDHTMVTSRYRRSRKVN